MASLIVSPSQGCKPGMSVRFAFMTSTSNLSVGSSTKEKEIVPNQGYGSTNSRAMIIVASMRILVTTTCKDTRPS